LPISDRRLDAADRVALSFNRRSAIRLTLPSNRQSAIGNRQSRIPWLP
jgi:hypothetical protein